MILFYSDYMSHLILIHCSLQSKTRGGVNCVQHTMSVGGELKKVKQTLSLIHI